MYCYKCKKEINDDSEFCNYCGQRNITNKNEQNIEIITNHTKATIEKKSSIMLWSLIGSIIVLTIIGNSLSHKTINQNEIYQNETANTVSSTSVDSTTIEFQELATSNLGFSSICITEEETELTSIIENINSENEIEYKQVLENPAPDIKNYIGEGYVDITSGVLNLRNKATTDSEVLAEIPKNVKLTLYSTDTAGWYYTFYKNKYGYVNADFISIIYLFSAHTTAPQNPQDNFDESETIQNLQETTANQESEESKSNLSNDNQVSDLSFLDEEFLNCQGFTYVKLKDFPVMYKGIYYAIDKEKSNGKWYCTLYKLDEYNNKKTIYSERDSTLGAIICNDHIYTYSDYGTRIISLDGTIEPDKQFASDSMPIKNGFMSIRPDFLGFVTDKSPFTWNVLTPVEHRSLIYMGEYNERYYFVCDDNYYYYDQNESGNSYVGGWNYICPRTNKSASYDGTIGRYAITNGNVIINLEEGTIIETSIRSVYQYINEKFGAIPVFTWN